MQPYDFMPKKLLLLYFLYIRIAGFDYTIHVNIIVFSFKFADLEMPPQPVVHWDRSTST